MLALAASGSLRLESAALLVLDMEKNVKGRDVTDMDGVATDTMQLLAEYVRPHLVSSNVSRKEAGGKGGKANAGQLRIALY